MPKQCKVSGCKNIPFNNKHGYCFFHLYKAKLATKIKRESKYTKAKKKSLKTPNFGFKTQVELFQWKWNDEPRVCFLTGKPIKQFDFKNFGHVLRKSKWTYWKLNPYNIRLLQPYVHNAVDNFKEEFIELYPEIDFHKWWDLQEQLKQEYEQFKKDNLLA